MKQKIAIVLPVYNEELTIAKVIDEVKKYADVVIVVDDCSTDKTIEKIKGARVILLRHMLNLGQGAALQTGFDYAKVNGIEVVVTFDSDGQFLATEIPSVLKPILKGKADVVLGSRFKGETINIPVLRKTILKLGILFTYVFSGIKLSDTHNGFKALNRIALDKIDITHDRMAHASEIIDEIARSGLRYVEVPVTVKYNAYSRFKGQGNANSLNIIMQLITQRMY